MLNRWLLAGAALCLSPSCLWAQTYRDVNGTVAPGFVPLIGCSQTNPLPVVVTGGSSGGGSAAQGTAASPSGAWPIYATVNGAAVSATNGLFVNPATGATFPVSGSVSVTGTVNTAASNPSAIYSGQQTCNITVAALPAQALVNGVVVKALKTNTATVYLGGSAVTTSTGYPLAAGEAISYAVANLSDVYLICQNATDVVAITGN
jgi:hypothetical protein